MRIGEMLVRMKVLTTEQVEAVLAEQAETHEPFGVIAERLYEVPSDTIERAWIEQTQLRATSFEAARGIEDDARVLVVRRQAWQFGIVPLRLDDGYLVAATSRWRGCSRTSTPCVAWTRACSTGRSSRNCSPAASHKPRSQRPAGAADRMA